MNNFLKIAKRLRDASVERVAKQAVVAGASTAAVSEDAEAGFFSQAVKAAQALQRKSGNMQSFWNDLTGKGQVKPDELNAMGFKEHFGNRNDISKEEVQQFINDNQISIDEVRLGGSLPDKPYFYRQNSSGFYDYFDDDGVQIGSRRTEEEAQAAVDEWNNTHRFSDDNSKFGRWTLDEGESGKNYRELLMRLPIDAKTKREIKALEKRKIETNAKIKPLNDKLRAIYKNEKDEKGRLSNDAYNRVYELEDAIESLAKEERSLGNRIHGLMNNSGYKSGHFDENNILTHLRMKDRVDVDGNKTLMVEEVQSDWHQSGKEFGYQNHARRQEIADRLEAINKRSEEIDSSLQAVRNMESDLSGKELDDLIDEFNDLSDKRLELQNEDFTLSEAIPNAPFKGDDKSSWYNLAMKRALMEAAEGDYDKLAFTTGAQQADRYNLRNFVSSLKYQEDIVDGRPVKILTAYDRDGHRVFNKGIKDPQTELPSIIGKEAAEKLLNADPYTPPQETRKIRTLRDQDLELGGEGMKQFYDRTLPNTLNKLVKQDGVKVGQTQLPSTSDSILIDDIDYSRLSTAERQELENLEKAYRNFLVNFDVSQEARMKELLGKARSDTVHSIDITPEMRERVKKGLSLFTTAVGVPTVGALFSPEGQASTLTDMAQEYGMLDERKQQAEAKKMALIKAESDRRRNMTRRQRRDNPPSEALRNYVQGEALRVPVAMLSGGVRDTLRGLDSLRTPNLAGTLFNYFYGTDIPNFATPLEDLGAPLTDIQVMQNLEADKKAKDLGGMLLSPI